MREGELRVRVDDRRGVAGVLNTNNHTIHEQYTDNTPYNTGGYHTIARSMLPIPVCVINIRRDICMI